MNDASDLMEGSNQDVFPGENYISRRSSVKAKKEKKEKKKKKKEKRESKTLLAGESSNENASLVADPSAVSYADSKYIKRPEPVVMEEQANLLHDSMNDFDQDDLLASGGIHDEFEDELTEIEMREEKRRNLDAFGQTAAPRKKFNYFVPMCIAVLFCFGIAATILYAIGYGKAKSTNSSSRNKIAQSVPPAPNTIAEMCADTGTLGPFEVPELCASYCEKAECCWNPGGAYICTDDSKQRCSEYQQPCAELARLDTTYVNVDGFEEMVVPQMPSTLQNSCDATTFGVPSAACREGCLKGECCWKETTILLCTEDSEEFCPDYEKTCGFLNALEEPKVPPASADLGVYCNPNDLQQTLCTDLCDKARCCWDHDVDSCMGEYGTECRAYSLSCGVLNHDDDGGPPFPAAPQDMGSLCNPSSLDAENCRGACSQARCCWDSEVNSCLVEYGQACHDYALSCGVLKDNGIAPFPAAPQDLGEKCNSSDEGGVVLCLEDCAEARCCWDDSVDLCVEQYGTDCRGYTLACSFLNERDASGNVATPPPAPEGLASICNPSILDQTTCRAGCNQGRCCWDSDIPSCVQEEGTACHDYTLACSHLNKAGNSGSSEVPFPAAPDGLGVDCNPAEMEEVSLQVCQENCDKAKCCWDRDTTSCVHQYAIDCHDYSLACGILNDLDTAPGNDNDITAVSAPGSNVKDIPEPPSDMSQKCSFESINSPDGGTTLVECEQDCLKASCCWQPNVESCASESVCEGYKAPCEMFKTLFGAYTAAPTPNEKPILSNVPVPSSNINLFCQEDVLSPDVSNGEFIVKCEEECLKGACCWKEDDPFVCPEAPQCDAYIEPCRENLIAALNNLRPDSGSDSSSGGGATGSGAATGNSEPPAAPADLHLACSVEDLETNVAAVGLCENYCEPASCCWTEDPTDSCLDQYPSTCATYEPCTIAFAQLAVISQPSGGATTTSPASGAATGNSEPPAAPADLHLACSVEDLETNVAAVGLCENYCEPASCCWTEDPTDSCLDQYPSTCETYAPCIIAFAQLAVISQPSGGATTTSQASSSSSVVPAPPSNLNDICSQTAIEEMKGLQICKQTCLKADCCWLDPNDLDSCSSDSACTIYKNECALMRQELQIASGGFSDAIAGYCDTSDPNYDESQCKQVCKPGECCYDTFAGECPAYFDCAPYKTACAVLVRRNMLRKR